MDTVYARHPDPDKQGTTVAKDRYDAVRTALMAVIPDRDEGIAFKDLKTLIRPHLPNGEVPRGGSAAWWVTTVKLDLEARGIIERVPKSRPQRVRRVAADGL